MRLLHTAVVAVVLAAAGGCALAAVPAAAKPDTAGTTKTTQTTQTMQTTTRTKTKKMTPTTRNPRRFEAVTGWHPRKLDYGEFDAVGALQPGRLLVATHPDFDAPVLLKMADAEDDTSSLAREVDVYRRLHGTDITPAFLGHVHDARGRSTGFVMEFIGHEGAGQDTKDGATPTTAAPAAPRSREACLAVLRRLHQHGIAHGDAHDGNCLLRHDGSAVIVDFEEADVAGDAAEMARDLDVMERCFRGSWRRA